METADFTMTAYAGPDAAAFVGDLAELRIRVFREYPYIYDGTVEYERKYLDSYFRAARAVCVIARTGDTIIGAATGLPLIDEDRSFAEPFIEAGIPRAAVFYFGESILLPQWRGRGLGHRFFDERERWARSIPGIRYTTFCAVDRPEDHPRKPAGYAPLDGFWQKRGYVKRPDLQVRFSWKEVGEVSESSKTMTYWLRDWATPNATPASASAATTAAT